MKTETQHTPGPWKIERGKRYVGDKFPIAHQDRIFVSKENHGMICELTISTLAVEANAELIASAPELLMELAMTKTRYADCIKARDKAEKAVSDREKEIILLAKENVRLERIILGRRTCDTCREIEAEREGERKLKETP